MSEFLLWISSGSMSAIIFITILAVLLIIIALIYIIAFFQGREISFWPPRIGIKPTESAQNKNKAITREKIKAHKVEPKPVRIKDITITMDTENDCNLFGIPVMEVKEFLAQEAQNHPQMFIATFNSMPLVFLSYVLLLSWDGSTAIAERILKREQAYPLNDAWTSCLALYRQATLLPYRTATAKELVLSTDTKRTIQHYEKLIRSMKSYLHLFETMQEIQTADVGNLESLLVEAEFSIANENVAIGVTRLEAILSTVHKLLLRHAPQPSPQNKEPIVKQQVFKPMRDNKLSALVIDDMLNWLEVLTYILEGEGFQVQAVSNGTEAMQALIEHDYDLVITDMRLSEGDINNQDGREIALAAKKANPKTRVVVISGYPGMTTRAELLEYDDLILKHSQVEDELIKILNQLREKKQSNDNAG